MPGFFHCARAPWWILLAHILLRPAFASSAKPAQRPASLMRGEEEAKRDSAHVIFNAPDIEAVKGRPSSFHGESLIVRSELKQRACGYKVDDAHQQSTLVVLRTHKPSPGMLQRMRQFAEDLHKHRWVSMRVMHIDSLDDTDLGGSPDVVEDIRKIPHTALFRTNLSHVQKEYPVLKETGIHPNGRREHVGFLLQTVHHMRHTGQLLDDGYVWMVEDDVGVCGSLSELIASYGNDTSDFISSNGLHRSKPSWAHINEASQAFLVTYPQDKRWNDLEFVERFSVRFLLHLEDLMRNRSIVSQWSEMFPATVCKNSEKFSCSSLKEWHHFNTYWEWNTAVSEADWRELCPSGPHVCHSPPRLAHALKW